MGQPMKTIKGDLLKEFPTNLDAIGHVCNCQGVMGSGIALVIKNQFPAAYSVYSAHMRHNTGIKLGTISVACVQPQKFIFNLHAQDRYGYDGFRYINYEAIYSALEIMRDHCIKCLIKSVGFPMNMGCDRAGGDWRIVLAMLEVIFENTDIEITIVSLK
jgi:O-acetyl-ADP-ribose deacetylase (regulator of RNase III)